MTKPGAIVRSPDWHIMVISGAGKTARRQLINCSPCRLRFAVKGDARRSTAGYFNTTFVLPAVFVSREVAARLSERALGGSSRRALLAINLFGSLEVENSWSELL